MILEIKKGSRRPSKWWAWLRLWYNKKMIRREIKFYADCKYTLPGDDQNDHNKLFGLGYFWNKKESARFGWRYNPDQLRIIISAYCHVNGKVVMEDICQAMPAERYQLLLRVRTGFYDFEVLTYDGSVQIGHSTVRYTHKKKWAYGLGLFFGGNNPAPNTLHVSMKGI